MQYFRKAEELDPTGYYGRLAMKHRRQHNVWGIVGMRAD